MEKKIIRYVEGVFSDVPSTDRTQRIKDEIIQNLLDKYADLVKAGKSEEDAYAIAISSGGDLSGIVADLKGETKHYNYNYEKQFCKVYEKEYAREKKKCSSFNSLLWPVVTCVYLLFSMLVHSWFYSWIIFLIACVISSAFKFYTVKSNSKVRRNALNSMVWMSATSLYFILSFITARWDMTWILFVLAVPMNKIAALLVFKEDDEPELD